MVNRAEVFVRSLVIRAGCRPVGDVDVRRAMWMYILCSYALDHPRWMQTGWRCGCAESFALDADRRAM
jgi:hypothetical protein